MAVVRETGCTFDQLAAMDGADYGALAADIRAHPPVADWLPFALVDVVQALGAKDGARDLLRRWGFDTEQDGMNDDDERFLRALRG